MPRRSSGSWPSISKKTSTPCSARPISRIGTRLSEVPPSGAGECPDLFELPVDGDVQKMKWVFWGGNNNYLIGGFDGKTFTQEAGPLSLRIWEQLLCRSDLQRHTGHRRAADSDRLDGRWKVSRHAVQPADVAAQRTRLANAARGDPIVSPAGPGIRQPPWRASRLERDLAPAGGQSTFPASLASCSTFGPRSSRAMRLKWD